MESAVGVTEEEKERARAEDRRYVGEDGEVGELHLKSWEMSEEACGM